MGREVSYMLGQVVFVQYSTRLGATRWIGSEWLGKHVTHPESDFTGLEKERDKEREGEIERERERERELDR